MTDRPLLAEPVEGWRAWQLSQDPPGALLTPIGTGNPWPRLDPAAARCWKHRRHRAPVVGCTCGLYMARDAAQLRRARSPGVVGSAVLWGRVVEHTSGWRGEFGYPQRIALVCHVCLFQRGMSGAKPDLVAAYADGRLVPLCQRHLRVAGACSPCGFDVLPARGLLTELTQGYAVERLAP